MIFDSICRTHSYYRHSVIKCNMNEDERQCIGEIGKKLESIEDSISRQMEMIEKLASTVQQHIEPEEVWELSLPDDVLRKILLDEIPNYKGKAIYASDIHWKKYCLIYNDVARILDELCEEGILRGSDGTEIED